MESSNVELSSRYVEMGLGISFATVAKDLPGVRGRALAFLPMDHIFKPDNIAIVLRKEKMLSSFKNAFIHNFFFLFSTHSSMILNTTLRSMGFVR
jgi:DNA-binding transcriptional LysR family regulator